MMHYCNFVKISIGFEIIYIYIIYIFFPFSFFHQCLMILKKQFDIYGVFSTLYFDEVGTYLRGSLEIFSCNWITITPKISQK